jgi:hypothetical protein
LRLFAAVVMLVMVVVTIGAARAEAAQGGTVTLSVGHA